MSIPKGPKGPIDNQNRTNLTGSQKPSGSLESNIAQTQKGVNQTHRMPTHRNVDPRTYELQYTSPADVSIFPRLTASGTRVLVTSYQPLAHS